IASLSNIVLTAPVCPGGSLSVTGRTGPTLTTNLKLRITAFPNPSRAQFSIKAESASSQEVEVNIVDLSGRKVFHTRTAANVIFLVGKNLSAGTYIIEALQDK